MKIRISMSSLLVASLVVGAGAEIQRVDRLQQYYSGLGPQHQSLPASIEKLRLEVSLTATASHELLASRSKPSFSGGEAKEVIIRLSENSASQAFTKGSNTTQAKHNAKAQQESFLKTIQILDPTAKVIAVVQVVLNAVFVKVDSSILDELSKHPQVVRVTPVANYEQSIAETVPYVGATNVQKHGYDGTGIKVAILDSGIDYLHTNLGGSGKRKDYIDNDNTVIEPGTFPTGKVIGGYDFVGPIWPDGDLLPDPDPLDAEGGHGTHVADIIAGIGGVAPGAQLICIQVCSAVASSCSGVALIQGMEYAVDPNGDGSLKGRVDIINMSLGHDYGQPFDNELAAAVDAATALGVLTVASAGNGSDKPYIAGTPASADSALSVAQTQVPSAFLTMMNVLNPISLVGGYAAVFQSWSAPLVSNIEGNLVYGDGQGDNLDGCVEFQKGSFLADDIVLVDRGSCGFSLKIQNIEAGGASCGIICLIAPGGPFEGGFGGGEEPKIPSYMVSQDDANLLKDELSKETVLVQFDPDIAIAQVMSMVGSSSRGPQQEAKTLIKPDIGAPGASLSAVAGSGDGEQYFGGTSGAAPMVAGAAALVLHAHGRRRCSSPSCSSCSCKHKDKAKGKQKGRPKNGHGLSPLEVKALLMNNAETHILNDVLLGDLAPITRIGGGELRVDRAIEAPIVAYDVEYPSGSLSFGFVDVAEDTVTLTKTVAVRILDDDDNDNDNDNDKNSQHYTYNVKSTFRFKNDEENGAVELKVPSSVTVKPGIENPTTFEVTMTIFGGKLRGNYMNAGYNGANADTLTLNEYDGYIILDDGDHPIQLPWHVLPRKASLVVPDKNEFLIGSYPDVIGINNSGVGTAQNDVFSLLAVSPNQPEGGRGQQSPAPDIRAVGINTYLVSVDMCSSGFLWAFAINTWERQEHLLPVSHQVYLDIDQDGTSDYLVLNRDYSLNGMDDGRQMSWSVDLNTGLAMSYFFAEHSMNTGNTVLRICGEQVGLNASDINATSVNMDVYAEDFYFGGPGDGSIFGLTVTPHGERYFGIPFDVEGGKYDYAALLMYDSGPAAFPGNTPELGIMLITNGDRGPGNTGGSTEDTELLLFEAVSGS